jgi:predicted ester cyclase
MAHLTANFRTEEETPVNRWFVDDTMFLEQWMTGTVIGELVGLPGNGRRITFKIFHVFEFRDGRISREQVWLDTGSVVAQLTA